MAIHELKCWPPEFRAMKRGIKNFEWRKFDRPFAVGDTLLLREWNATDGYSGDELAVQVTFLISGVFGIPDEYCVMSTALAATHGGEG